MKGGEKNCPGSFLQFNYNRLQKTGGAENELNSKNHPESKFEARKSFIFGQEPY